MAREMTAAERKTWERVVALRDAVGERGVYAGFVLKGGKHMATVFRKVTSTSSGLRYTVALIDFTTDSGLLHPQYDFEVRAHHYRVVNGGGYDMLTAALDGAKVAGYTFVDHGRPAGRKEIQPDRLPKGWMFLKGWSA